MSSSTVPLLAMTNISLEYKQGFRRPPARILHGVDFSINRGETVGLVGESGSGKTSLARIALGLLPPTGGKIEFNGKDITHAGRKQRRLLASQLQVIFQDPYSSLNPTRRIGLSVAEPLRQQQRDLTAAQVTAKVDEMLARVGLTADAANRYPTQFSGGQRQRIAIARALIVAPDLVVCDEPVSALDLSVQAQVLNLLAELQRSLHLSYLFIAHDLAVVRFLSNRIVVMSGGQIVESGPAAQVYESPANAYTQRLLASIPDPDPDHQNQPGSADIPASTTPLASITAAAHS